MKCQLSESIFILIFLISFFNAGAQQSVKHPLIIYGDALGGFSGGSNSGIDGGFSLNYQRNKFLYTARFIGTYSNDLALYFNIIPMIWDEKENDEFSFLFGRRIIFNNYAVSFSGGISANRFTDRIFRGGQKTETHLEYAGFPFEAAIQLFKRRRTPYHLLWLIPIGPPTSFGHDIGFKLYGNASKRDYLGAGISYGLGIHKQY